MHIHPSRGTDSPFALVVARMPMASASRFLFRWRVRRRRVRTSGMVFHGLRRRRNRAVLARRGTHDVHCHPARWGRFAPQGRTPLEQGWRSSYWSHLSTRVAQPAYGRDPTAVGHRDGDLSGTVNEWRLCSFCCRRWWTQQEQQPHNHRRHVSPWAAHRAASCSAPLDSFGSAGE